MLIEKLFGWMKLDNEQNIEEYSNINSVVSDTDGIKSIQSETEIIEAPSYSIDTSVQNINRNKFSNEDTLQAEIPPKRTIIEKMLEEENLHKATITEDIIEEMLEEENLHKETIIEDILEKESFHEKPIIEGMSEEGNIHEEIVKEELTEEKAIQKEIVKDKDIPDVIDEQLSYLSERKIILGVHIQFIDIAREVVQEHCIKTIPLMREFHLQKTSLNEILKQLREANIIGQYNQILMTSQELEKFLDIYEPTLFNCQHTIFDREIFLCMGEIIFDKGVDDVYDSMDEDEVLDYLTIMEKLNIIAYNSETNEYDIISSKEDFLSICECIPRSFSNEEYKVQEQDYQGKDFDNMTGLEFERYCGYILQKNSFSEIKITQASGDHGIDILAEKGGIKYAFQCKCYSNNVGNEAVQQAHTGKCLYHMDIAVVITNRHFTQQAQEEAKQLGVKLWDRDKLEELIKNSTNIQ